MEPEEQKVISFDTLQKESSRILTRYHETAVSIEQATLLTEPKRRNRLWRCHLHSAERLVPETVIIKQVRPEGYDPSDPESWDTNRFFNDWAGAQFLWTTAREEGHGPAFYGGHLEQGFIILEDMGEHTSLVEPLLKEDVPSATVALIAFAQRLGRMHASSVGKEEIYRDIQRTLSPAWAAKSVKSPETALQGRMKQIAELTELCTRLGINLGEKEKEEFGEALQRLEEPGPFLTFIHGDPCPDNVFYHAPELRLIDFEFSAFGHALKDGLYGRLPFPTCWCANAVPPDVVQKMEQTYRAELSTACPEVLDEYRFACEAAAVAASCLLNTLSWHLESALEQDGEWGIAGTRARILTRLEMFSVAARTAHQFPVLRETCEKLLAELHRQWQEASALPIYPAFRGASTEGISA